MPFLPHLPSPGAETESGPGRGGSGNILNMCTIYIRWNFFLHCIRKSVNGWLLKLGSHFFSTWHCVKCDSICTTGNDLKINYFYTFEEYTSIDIVRLADVHVERDYVYCSLFFTSKNEIKTVRHTLEKGTHVLWKIMDLKEYDELMSRKLWYDVTRDEELLEFDF